MKKVVMTCKITKERIDTKVLTPNGVKTTCKANTRKYAKRTVANVEVVPVVVAEETVDTSFFEHINAKAREHRLQEEIELYTRTLLSKKKKKTSLFRKIIKALL